MRASCVLRSFLLAIWPTLLCAQVRYLDAKVFSEIFDFPATELVVKDVRAEEEAMNGGPLMSAYRITSKTPFAFYPVVISVAPEGTFFRSESQKKIAAADALPDRPFEKGGRGPFGSLTAEPGVQGGIYFGEVKVPPPADSNIRSPFRCMAFIAELRVLSSKREIRIVFLVLHGGDKLVKVSGGEKYFERLHEEGGDQFYEDPPRREEFDIRGRMAALARAVHSALSASSSK